MKKQDRFQRLSYIKDFSLMTEDMRFLFKQFKNKSASSNYDVCRDLRVLSMFQNSNNDPIHETVFLDTLAFALAVNIARYDINTPSADQLKEMQNVYDVTDEEFFSFIDEKYYLNPSAVYNQANVPVVFFITYAIRNALVDKRKGNKKKEIAKLQALLHFMWENDILCQFEDNAMSEYDDYIITHSGFYLRQHICVKEFEAVENYVREKSSQLQRDMTRELAEIQVKFQEKMIRSLEAQIKSGILPPRAKTTDIKEFLSTGYFPELSAVEREMFDTVFDSQNEEQIVPEGIDSLLKKIAPWTTEFLNKYKNMKDDPLKPYTEAKKSIHEKWKTEYDKIQGEKKQRLLDEFHPVIAEGALLSLIDGDDIYRTDLGLLIWHYFFEHSDFPLPLQFMPALADADKWNVEQDHCNLTTTIIGEDDIVELLDDNNETKTSMRASTLLARLGGTAFDSPLKIRKSIIKYFKSIGCSERRSRDYALIISMLQRTKRADCQEVVRDLFKKSTENDDDRLITNEMLFQANAARQKAEQGKLQAERETQHCRHEIGIMKKEILRLQNELRLSQAELEKRDELLSLYEQPQDDSDNTCEIEDTDFPYSSPLRVVLYGGFPVFQRELLKYIPNIRIIENASHISLSPIKNADILFVQINLASHSNYWAVMDAARINNVPFYHLNFASAKKCASFMVEQIQNQIKIKS